MPQIPVLSVLSSAFEDTDSTVIARSNIGKSVQDIRNEIRETAINICEKEPYRNGEIMEIVSEENTELQCDSAESTFIESPTHSIGESCVSATSSHKENVLPRKKVKAQRRLTMTYSHKRRKKSGQQSQTSSSTPKKRGRKPSTSSSTVSVQKAPEETKENGDIGDVSSNSDNESDDDEDDDEEDVYSVERIDGKQIVEGVTYYFIKWKGWDESANTWEPHQHLNNCADLLEVFEKKLVEKTKSKKQKNRHKGSDDEDENHDVHQTRENMRSYGILSEWPADKEAISVEGVITVDGVLTYVVKREARRGSTQLDRTNAMLVHSQGFREYYPHLIIKYYESRILWCHNEKSIEEQATLAAQMTLLSQNKGSKTGKDIVEQIDKDIKEDYEEMETDEPGIRTNSKLADLETQVIQTEDEDDEDDEIIELHASGDKLDLYDGHESSGSVEGVKKDGFGLPEDLETDVSSSDNESAQCDDDEYQEINLNKLRKPHRKR